ncbi:cadmium-translocating P-type ATPase [Methylonatrum kenyense]|uniref:heavy metal translocating P-type ATPase n=1 Tax=Methylonatrum kenyense TaxID=455253 RepID=UPI0020370D66|nr:heavy metal translocating P-type ATPase [Methylonatrum kenyense]MCK8515622.1 cadmium-translocating P-type ATPase [Methylonatrum kenyense]
MTTTCYHCGDAVPADCTLEITVDDAPQPICCSGCHAVASMIFGAGLDDFYKFRPAPTGRPEDISAGRVDRYARFDEDRVQQDFVFRDNDGICEASLLIEGLYCTACGWLIERSLDGVPGIREIRVNPATGRAMLRWDPDQVHLSQLMAHMGRLGYQPHPVLADAMATQANRERRSAMRRLIVAGLGMMQAMMFAVALYFGQYHGMDPDHMQFLRLVSMLVATPVVLYAGLPIFLGAIRDLRNLRPGMDVPVSLAIGAGYFASVWVTFMGGPEIYFDSISMFTFFLLVARYVEMAARHRANATNDALARLVPDTAIRLGGDGGEEEVPLRDLSLGDRLLVRPGATIPADGTVLRGHGRVDESMLTGESDPQVRYAGSSVVGGSVNLGDSIEIRVDRLGQDTVVSHISRLLRRAQAERPGLARLADTVARYFVSVVLVAALTVFAVWWRIDPAMAFPVTLAMLVATCPCALSLATPTALAAGTNRMASNGLLVTRGDALETLAKVNHVVLDKTGTLTEGRLGVVEVRRLSDCSDRQALAIASALEHHSEHPLARAFPRDPAGAPAENAEVVRGAGVDGSIAGQRYRIGRPDWVADLSGAGVSDELARGAWVVLGNEHGLLAAYRLADRLRSDAAETVAALQAAGIDVEIASGDAPSAVEGVAERLSIRRWQARMSPEQKLARLRQIQAEGAVVLMVGDGINDAPVLAGANVSAALNEGTALAQTSAAMVLLGGRLRHLADGLATARRTLRVIRQNLALSASYNASVLPLAAMGLVPPWLAAIGMTLSSVVVVMNARRLCGRDHAVGRCVLPPANTRSQGVLQP